MSASEWSTDANAGGHSPTNTLDEIISSTEASFAPANPMHKQVHELEGLSKAELGDGLRSALLKLKSLMRRYRRALRNEAHKLKVAMAGLEENEVHMLQRGEDEMKGDISVLIVQR